MEIKIPFNKAHLTGQELKYLEQTVMSNQISGNGQFTALCHQFFEQKYEIKKALLTSSCTDALEMAAILLDVKEGDEIIMPSYTFVSTANAFVLRGAQIVFCDSRSDHPGIDEDLIEDLITEKTRAIVPVHYAGVACNMEKIMSIAKKYNLFVVEDAAQGIDSYFTFSDGSKKALGSIGHLGAFSFHETKNIISGEGGLLAVNHNEFIERAEIIWEKGTNRAAFSRGEVKEYEWVDMGSSFLPSEITAAFLYAQLNNIEIIQNKRRTIWERYNSQLQDLPITTPNIPDFSTNNANMFYMICQSKHQRNAIIEHLAKRGIMAVFHYLCLHQSSYYSSRFGTKKLEKAELYANNLVRLPFYFDLIPKDQDWIISEIHNFFKTT